MDIIQTWLDVSAHRHAAPSRSTETRTPALPCKAFLCHRNLSEQVPALRAFLDFGCLRPWVVTVKQRKIIGEQLAKGRGILKCPHRFEFPLVGYDKHLNETSLPDVVPSMNVVVPDVLPD
uniref:Uncharacterized protein n=1 Tax=Cupriavidus pinatubonensis (strain JMP 134 / LMG 1197) TaxID=264198 RepID=Q46QS4_CUPPJ